MTKSDFRYSWYVTFVLVTALLIAPRNGHAMTVDDLLAADEAPAGVVFEIVEGDSEALTWAIPLAKKLTAQLRDRFPGLAVAVVSHGYEQFLLQTENRNAYAAVHDEVLNLASKSDVPVHICATHASWYDVTPDDFPDYIDSAPSGPAQISAYEALGYQLIRITDAE